MANTDIPKPKYAGINLEPLEGFGAGAAVVVPVPVSSPVSILELGEEEGELGTRAERGEEAACVFATRMSTF